MNAPLFSIITVTYNAEQTVGRTVESVANQTFDDYEHIVIDGASSDGTLSAVQTAGRQDRRSILSEADKGLYDAMNKGISMATGEYLVFLNAGDKFHSNNTLQMIADAISDNEGADIVYGQTDLVDKEGKFIAPRHIEAPRELNLKDFANGMVVCHQAFVVRRSIAPYFSLKYRYSADYEWCIICLMHSSKNVYVDAVLIDYLYEGLTTANRNKSLRERFSIMTEYYGFWPTLWRHIGFIPRFFKHKKAVKEGTDERKKR